MNEVLKHSSPTGAPSGFCTFWSSIVFFLFVTFYIQALKWQNCRYCNLPQNQTNSYTIGNEPPPKGWGGTSRTDTARVWLWNRWAIFISLLKLRKLAAASKHNQGERRDFESPLSGNTWACSRWGRGGYTASNLRFLFWGGHQPKCQRESPVCCYSRWND